MPIDEHGFRGELVPAGRLSLPIGTQEAFPIEMNQVGWRFSYPDFCLPRNSAQILDHCGPRQESRDKHQSRPGVAEKMC